MTDLQRRYRQLRRSPDGQRLSHRGAVAELARQLGIDVAALERLLSEADKRDAREAESMKRTRPEEVAP
jgi:hypothetical protein